MKAILRNALRKYHGLREHLDRMLIGEDGESVETELKKFVCKQPCWQKKPPRKEAKSDTGKTRSLFVSPTAQLRLVKKWILQRSWGFTKADFDKLGKPPTWPVEPLCVVILEVTLDTVEKTFEEAWNCARSVQPNHWRWPELKSGTENLRLLEGIKHERGLCWRVIDLSANWDKVNGIRPVDVRNAKGSPAQAIIWASPYFPKWVQAMDGVNVPYSWIPGYEANISGYVAWASVPDLFWDRGDRRVQLVASPRGDRYREWAVPAFRE